MPDSTHRVRFEKSSALTLVEFAIANPHHPNHPKSVLERFLNDLISNENLVFDYYSSEGRILTAVLIDEIQNPSNSANLEIIGVKTGPQEPTVLRQLLSDAKAALPTSRSGIEFSLNTKSAIEETLLLSNGFMPVYKTFEMYKANSQTVATAALPTQLRWQPLTITCFEEYYEVLQAAFAKNLETSIPPIEEMKKNFAKSTSPATLLFDGQRIIGFVSIAIDEDDFELGIVHMIGLHPEYRQRRLGSILLAQAIHELTAKGARRYKLTVAATNSDALHLYKKFSFEVIDEDTCFRYSR